LAINQCYEEIDYVDKCEEKKEFGKNSSQKNTGITFAQRPKDSRRNYCRMENNGSRHQSTQQSD